MSNESTYRAPKITDASQVTPVFVRDELLKCFQSASKEFLVSANQPIPSDKDIQHQVNQFVTGAFQSCGASIDHPTRESIIAAIEQCKRNAKVMMGDKGDDIINHHYEEMIKIVRLMK